MIMYGLKNKKTGKLMGFNSHGNDGDFCTDVEYELSDYSSNIWLVENKDTAEKAAETDTSWYNRNYETPGNDYVGNLEVVKVELNY